MCVMSLYVCYRMQLRAYSGYHHKPVAPSALQIFQDKQWLRTWLKYKARNRAKSNGSQVYLYL